MTNRKMKSVIVSYDGPLCHRCKHPTAVYEHSRITQKHLRSKCYYTRWFRCLNKKCKTTLIMPEEFRVWNQTKEESERLQQILDQLQIKE